jgi:Holliday junction resolvase RusA-like endonuclease
MRIVVYGRPAPQGSKSFKGLTRAGRPILAESSKAVKPWRQCVHAAAVAARDGASPMEGPLRVRMIFTVPKPKSAPRRRRTWPDRAPDLSKLARSTEDALTDAGVWEDDARVVEYTRLAKVFPGEDPEALEAPGVVVEVERAEAVSAPDPRQPTMFD